MLSADKFEWREFKVWLEKCGRVGGEGVTSSDWWKGADANVKWDELKAGILLAVASRWAWAMQIPDSMQVVVYGRINRDQVNLPLAPRAMPTIHASSPAQSIPS